MATSAISNYGAAAANPQMNTNPMSTASGTSAGSGSEASISANDFLTLLVTEMKNQDPTATTDPNEYINQLVQVNSLEQLISINQNLSTALGTSATGSGQAVRNPQEPVNNNANSAPGIPVGTNSGNLSVPRTSSAALRVGHALGRP